MTYRSLRRRLLAVVALLNLALLVSLAEYLPRFWPDLSIISSLSRWLPQISSDQRALSSNGTFVSQNAALIALVAGAYSAYCLQQRGKFIDELRAWWNEMVQAKSTLFKYCDSEAPCKEIYLEAFYKLSTAMDTLRLIYGNVDRDKRNPKGYYPFEQVRDMVDIARWLEPDPKLHPPGSYGIARAHAKRAIDVVFQSLRHAIQAEARASIPDMPTRFDSPYRSAYISELKAFDFDLLAIRNANKTRGMITDEKIAGVTPEPTSPAAD
jgi:hypothetical protein